MPEAIIVIQSLQFLQRECISFAQDVNMLSSVMSYFRTLKEFINKPDPLENKKKEKMKGPIQKIIFDNVTFAYQNSETILKNLSFSVASGEKVAIVGENGSGKSSLVKLLCRFYDPLEGSILVDGIDLKDLDVNEWRSHLSTVFQDFGKYPLTLRENIGIANYVNMSDSNKINQSLKKAGLDYFLNKFSSGIQTQLGKEFSGQELSIGEWQKLAISRLFFKNSSVIVMDEPTASLDPDSEFELFKKLIEAFDKKTVFLITHRLNSVKLCNKILLLKDGKISEQGSHEDLMANKKEYYRLFKLQASGYSINDYSIV